MSRSFAPRIELVLQALRVLVRHIGIFVVESVLLRLLLRFELGDLLRLGLVQLAAFATPLVR